MIVTAYAGGKNIILSKALDSRAKALNIFYFVSFTCGGAGFLKMAMADGVDTFGLAALIVAVVGVYLFAGYRFLNKALQTESLVITKQRLEIVKTGLFARQTKAYEVQHIYDFRHLGKPDVAQHPLAGQSVDYLGFQMQQQVINEMHGDNRLAFDYDGRVVTFGENVYTWDFEEMDRMIYDITGKDLKVKKSLEEDLFAA